MSPFSQLRSLPGVGGYGGGIDRDFSPILNYLDEFDRHFSSRHRFINCFIPRFDLEEDAHNYYLYGDLPGATIETISIEAHSNNTLAISGKTTRSGPPLPPQTDAPESTGETSDFVKVQVEDQGHKNETGPGSAAPPVAPEHAEKTGVKPYYPPPPTQGGHPQHERHRTYSNEQSAPYNPSGHRVLLSERLVGDFHRTFAFPSPVVEEGVKASLENGVLSLVVPKKEGGSEKERGRRVPIVHGNWWKGDERGSGFGFGGGAV
ncbi:HSP20-like chaperone [Acephala macrosclerotiorum]|nr:HSP20-like chaperone [Acephala macrosclerotiorum]